MDSSQKVTKKSHDDAEIYKKFKLSEMVEFAPFSRRIFIFKFDLSESVLFIYWHNE